MQIGILKPIREQKREYSETVCYAYLGGSASLFVFDGDLAQFHLFPHAFGEEVGLQLEMGRGYPHFLVGFLAEGPEAGAEVGYAPSIQQVSQESEAAVAEFVDALHRPLLYGA